VTSQRTFRAMTLSRNLPRLFEVAEDSNACVQAVWHEQLFKLHSPMSEDIVALRPCQKTSLHYDHAARQVPSNMPLCFSSEPIGWQQNDEISTL